MENAEKMTDVHPSREETDRTIALNRCEAKQRRLNIFPSLFDKIEAICDDM
jgi:hypothetical protein